MAKSSNVFDMERLLQYVEFMKENDLTEIDLEQDGQKVRLSRGGVAQPIAAAPAPVVAAPVTPADDTSADDEGDHIVTIDSPMVGTFYASSNPDSPAFIKVGDSVGKDTTVCIVEAMKVFNEIPAEISGKIVAVLVNDQDPVDCGKPMFKVDTRG
ncbi:MAG: acetyl-CoA carboxylase biotin carboxyl carrier protein [Pirellulales bacterium]|jgi:acetyl-CoA carboxylase biotin carboxyl carrier protein|nr:acetyl-CoA carboxylase, biotin carboxyl carrier protein [Rhodopirellula sp.]MCH2370476.1 acetyl-CoA carboxylase biotin carboxyl carrier protein [Pirellulales bacterium]